MTLRWIASIAALTVALPLAAQNAKEVLASGRKEWLRYETQANQAPGCDDISPTLDSARTQWVGGVKIELPIETGLRRIHNQLVNCRAPMNVGGEGYAKAEALFRQANSLAPADPVVFRNLAMLLAERNRWKELAALARDHVTRAPDGAWGWLALGLAKHRTGENASAVFDTAAAKMNREDRARLFSFTQLLTPPDSVAYMKAREDARAETEKRFWALADPLWSREGNDPKTEFMARVAFAELRWTVEESNVRGADSDRGEVYIRYGPPQRIVAMRGDDFRGNDLRDGLAARNTGSSLLPGRSDVVTYWDYDNGLIVVFWGAPTFGTARFPSVDGPSIGEIVALRSSSFDNLASERILDMPSLAVRFRGPADSVDVLVIAQAPIDEIRGAIGANARVRADAWFLGLNTPRAFHDSTNVRASGIERWTYRVAPASYQSRVEVTADGANIAARTFLPVNASPVTDAGFVTRGFGTSDVLLATTVQEPRVPGQPTRWSDFAAAPIVGVMQRASTFSLLWENYDVTARNGQAQYQVAVTVQKEKSGAGKVAAALVGFAANALRIDRRDDRVISRFDRSVPPSPVIVDHVSVSLGDSPAGTYKVTLEITDVVTGKKSARTTNLVIRD